MTSTDRIIAAAVVATICHVPFAKAQQPDQPAPPISLEANAYAPYVIGLPVVYYTPETRLAFGAGGLLGFWLGPNQSDTRPSSIPFFFVYTQNKQTQMMLKPDIYLPGNRYLLSGTFRFERMPQKFFGIGQPAAAAVPEFYTPQTFGVQVAVKKRLSRQVWAGIQYDFERTTMRDRQAGGLLAGDLVPGSRGGVVSGLGVSVNVDTRDSVLFPRRGRYFQLAVDHYAPAIGSDFAFTNIKFDFRTYASVRKVDVVAAQVYVKSRGGSPPFYQLAFLGGDSLLRGYYRGRYRDTAAVVAQAEYRAHIWKRLGAAVFAGLGEVSPGLNHFSANGVVASMGGGLRIKLDSKGGTNLRIEYAAGRKANAFYITVQEAF